MKLRKSLFMLCAAGLSLCACNSDEIKNQMPEGPGMVEVSVINPFATTKAAATSGNTVNIQGTLTVTLTHANGILTQTLTIGAEDEDDTKTAQFWNVVNPQSVTASINGGLASYESVNISNSTMQVAPNVIPAYGKTMSFSPDGSMTATDADAEVTGNGYKNGDAGKSFTKYKAAITMAIPVARLEVGHITHSAHTEDACDFSELKIAGVYLDKVSVNGSAYSGGSYAKTESAEEYTEENAILKDFLNEPAVFSSETFYPAEDEVYAFNFFAGSQNPIFKVHFSSAKFATGAQQGQEREGWAMITRYKKKNPSTGLYDNVTFENGKIYQITDVELKDENIVGDEENNAIYGVEVTVTEAVWEVFGIEADWAQ